MSRRKQEGTSLRTVRAADDNRRVCLVKNLDRSFAFLEWTFLEADGYWVPTRIGAGSRCKTVADAERDAVGGEPRLGQLTSQR
jgi:hypothetical protein